MTRPAGAPPSCVDRTSVAPIGRPLVRRQEEVRATASPGHPRHLGHPASRCHDRWLRPQRHPAAAIPTTVRLGRFLPNCVLRLGTRFRERSATTSRMQNRTNGRSRATSLAMTRSGANGEHTMNILCRRTFGWKLMAHRGRRRRGTGAIASCVPMWNRIRPAPQTRCRRGRKAIKTEKVSMYMVARNRAQPGS
jgi:hypothetical protein